MLPQRNVVSFDHKSSQRRNGTSGGSNTTANGRRIMIKVTRNPFFNFRTLIRHGVGAAATAGRNAVALSTLAGREWSALNDQQKWPYRRLAHLSKMNGGPFFVHLEHLRTFIRYPECVGNNEYLLRVRRSSGSKGLGSVSGGSGQRSDPHSKPQSREWESSSKPGLRSNGASPQPDANFGGYDVAPKGKN